MIDNFAIVSMIVLTAIVVVRAITLDRTMPWFGKKPVPPKGNAPPNRTAR